MNLKVEGATTLNEGPFEDIRGPERALVELALVMREQGDGTSSLVLEMNDGNSPVKVVEKGEDGTPFIAIDKDCDITFILSPKLRWWFDNAAGGLKMKKHLCQNLYRITKSGKDKPTELTLHAKWSRISRKEACETECHPFNFYVVLEQPGGAKPLPICIDPDVKNPPPGHS
jgi:hypothetical protein